MAIKARTPDYRDDRIPILSFIKMTELQFCLLLTYDKIRILSSRKRNHHKVRTENQLGILFLVWYNDSIYTVEEKGFKFDLNYKTKELRFGDQSWHLI